jgi:transcription antitermination factor NusG
VVKTIYAVKITSIRAHTIIRDLLMLPETQKYVYSVEYTDEVPGYLFMEAVSSNIVDYLAKNVRFMHDRLPWALETDELTRFLTGYAVSGEVDINDRVEILLGPFTGRTGVVVSIDPDTEYFAIKTNIEVVSVPRQYVRKIARDIPKTWP